MQFVSTRNHQLTTSFTFALQMGLAEDGGLFVPEHFPVVDLDLFNREQKYFQFAETLISMFMHDDPLSKKLDEICQHAFNFPVRLKSLNDQTHILELFHGPTLSFKDFGARFLANAMNHIPHPDDLTFLVATSGDTGSAVASAFYQKPGVRVVVLFPEGQISTRQEGQITCWGENVLAISVKSNFDDCQQLVKSAFMHPWWRQHATLSTANSINIGRLLPQIVYYAYASIQFHAEYQQPVGVIVPSGNLGNVTAAYWAKQLGFPIREIAIATNANHVVEDYLETGEFVPRDSIATLANAMDVGKPSNFERLVDLFPEFSEFHQHVRAMSVDDEAIRETIIKVYRDHNEMVCPHTATALYMREHLSDEPWIVVATAHPCKFETVLEPLLHQPVPPTPMLQALLDRPQHFESIEPDMDALIDVYSRYQV